MRLFVAIDIPENVRRSLSDLSRDLSEIYPSARWVRMENVHLTLKFVGEIDPNRAEKVFVALRQARASAAIELDFAGLGFFPDARHPHVMWAGVKFAEPLRELAASIEERLVPIGIAREKREFSPHITLARFQSLKGFDALHSAVEKLGQPVFGHASAREFHLYQSVLNRRGAEYTRLASYSVVGESSA